MICGASHLKRCLLTAARSYLNNVLVRLSSNAETVSGTVRRASPDVFKNRPLVVNLTLQPFSTPGVAAKSHTEHILHEKYNQLDIEPPSNGYHYRTPVDNSVLEGNDLIRRLWYKEEALLGALG